MPIMSIISPPKNIDPKINIKTTPTATIGNINGIRQQVPFKNIPFIIYNNDKILSTFSSMVILVLSISIASGALVSGSFSR